MNDEELKQFTENMRQLNDVMPNLIAGMSLQSKLLHEQAVASGTATGAYNTANKRMKDGESTVDNYFKSLRDKTEFEKADAEATKKHAEAMNNWTNAGSKSVDALKGFGSALLDTTNSFSKYGSSVTSATGAVSSLASNFGRAGQVVAAFVKGAGFAVNAFLKQADQVLKAYDDMASFGAASDLTTKQITEMGFAAGYSTQNLDKYIAIQKSLGTDMIGLGSTVSSGAKTFGELSKLNEKEIDNYRRLGVSQEQFNQNQADSIKLMMRSGQVVTDRMKTDGTLRQRTVEYTDSLLQLAALTGENVDALKKQKEAAVATANAQIYLANMADKEADLKERAATETNADTKKELIAEADRIHKEAARTSEMLTIAQQTMSPEKFAAFSKMATHGVITPEGGKLLAGSPELMQNIKDIKSGIKDPALIAKYLGEGTDRQRRNAGFAASASDEAAAATGLNDPAAFKNATAMRGKTEQQVAEGAKEARFMATAKPEDLQKREDEVRKQAAVELDAEKKKSLLGQADQLKAKREDPALDMRNKMLNTERDAQIALSKLLLATNPLINGFTFATTAATVLAAAAGAAALSLGYMAGKSMLGKIGLGGAAGATGAPAATATKGAVQLDKNGKPLTGAAKTAREAKLAREAAAAVPVATPTVPTTPVAGAAAGESKLAKAASSLGKLAGPLSKFAKGVPYLTTALGVVTGGVTAYEGVKKSDEDVASGKITKDEATVQKAEAVGKGTGQAAGAAGGAWGGMAAGAALGTMLFPGIGTIIGGALGTAVGGYLGSKGGEMIGETVGKVAGEKMIAKPIVPTATPVVPTATPVVPTATPVQNTAAADMAMALASVSQTDATEKQVVITTSFNKKLEEATISLGNLTVSFNKFNTSLKDNLDTKKDTATTEKANADSIKGAFIDIDKLRTQITTNKNVSSAKPGTQIITEKNASSVIAGGHLGSMSKEQQKWLGGADVTDPFIRERMNKAIPPKPTGEGGDMSKYLQSIAMIESGGNTNAKAKTSSAAGLFQFTDATWKDMTKKMGKDYSLEDKTDPAKATEVAEFFTKLQKTQLEKGTGKEANSTDMYMAHFLGAGGATSFLNALGKDPSKSAAEHVGKKAADANIGIFYDQSGKPRSLDEVYKLMESKIGKAEQSVTAGAFGGKPLPDAVAKIGTSATNKPSTMVASAPATPTAAISSAAPSGGGGTKVASLTPKATDTVTTRGVSSSSKGDKDAGSDMKDLLAFTSNTGSMENFKDLNGNLQQQILAAAADYNETTGKKLIINSAKRASEDQQRLYDETVKAGRPGKGPTGMAVGKPGKSAHERGDAVDIQQGKGDSVAIAALNAKGLQQTVANDPVHFQLPQAKNGGIFNGLESGFPVELHGGGGGELIKRLDPNSILEKLATTPAPIEPPAAPTAVAAGPVSNIDTIMGDMIRMNASMMEMMTDKLNVMIDKLGTSNDLQDQLLKNSLV